MAYTTEEQDFQSFMSKVKQFLPLILLAVAIVSCTYAGITWYNSYKVNKAIDQFNDYQKIVVSTSNENENLNLRADLLSKYIKENPEKALAAIGILTTAHEYVNKGQYQQALDLINQIPADNEFSPELVAIDKAKLLLQLGRGQEAIAPLDKVQEGPWYVNARTLSGDIYYSILKYDLALAEYIKARDYLNKEIAGLTEDQGVVKLDLEGQVRYVQSRINIVQSLQKESALGNVSNTATPPTLEKTTPTQEPQK